MPATTTPKTTPVEDSVSKVNNEIAVGSDLNFQARWMKMERLVWILLTAFIVLNLAGAFGRGPLAKAHVSSNDGSMRVDYERIERFSTPSMMTVEFGPRAVNNGAVQLWVSDDLVKPLGNQRVVPQPERSVVGQGGILYTFLASGQPLSVAFSLQPSQIGASRIKLQVPGMAPVTANIFVAP